MTLAKCLSEEMKKQPSGVYSPNYFRFLGYRQELAAPAAILRANGVHTLFAEPTPVILKNEIIAGNRKSLFTDTPQVVLNYADTICNSFGNRTFITNNDHYCPNYAHIVEVGIGGLLEEINRSLIVHRDDPSKCQTLTAMSHTLSGFSTMIEKYALQAKLCKEKEGYNSSYLDFIVENCRAIVTGKPQTFAQGLQLIWFCHLAFLMEGRFAMAFGRLDQYLYPLYRQDIDAGTITDTDVIAMLENVFIRLHNDDNDVVNICIGGQNIQGECAVNDLSRCILQAVKNCNVPGPNLSLRLTENTPDDFLDDCLKSIGTGLGYPALMNDDINIQALKAYGYEDNDVYNYSMVGCIENFITGMQPPWSDGRFDTPRFFDFVFNNGISETNQSAGPDTGDVEAIASMQEFMDKFLQQLAYGVQEYVAKFHNDNDRINQDHFPDPFLSCFCYDCIGRGVDIHNGGSKYPSVHGAAVMGIGTVADSLAAIEKVVFTDHEATLGQLKDAMNQDFMGFEVLREKLLAAPKYGNNDGFVDKYAIWLIDYLSELFGKYKTRDGGGIYIAAAANISNILAGRTINATPDGRKRREPLSDAASPTYGRDKKGATSTLNSVSKPDYTKVACGSVVNQKFSPSMFSDEKRKKLMALIRAYFKAGGQELQINATSRDILLDAMAHPENYQNLVVRVSGFSAFYVTLDRDVQLDILNRTQQE